MSLELVIISVSLLAQLISAFFSLRLILVTRQHLAGILILAAIILMAFRRCISLYRLTTGGVIQADLIAEIIALIVSLLLLSSVIYITRLLLSSTKANESLSISEERFRTLANAAFEGIAITENGVVIDASQQLADMLGYTIHELMGRPVTDFIVAEDRELVRGNISKGYEMPYENRLLCKDGTIITAETRARHFVMQKSTVRVTVLRDITERMQIEEKLRMFSAAVEEAPDGVQLIDLTGMILYSNKAVQKIYGVLPHEYDGRHVNEMNADPEFAERVILPQLREKGEWAGELMVKHKDGRTFPIWLTTALVKNSKGEPIAAVGITRDMSARKKLQDLIVLSKKEWEETFDVINDAITIHDKDFNIIRANKTAKNMLGLSFKEIIGQKCHQLYHGLDSPPEGCASCLALKTGMPSTIETFEPHLDKFLEIKAFPRFDENNQVLKLVHVIRDITKRKRTEDELRDSERFLRESQKVAQLGSYALDVRSGTWKSSQVLDELFGIGKEYPRDVEGWFSLIHPQFRAYMVKYFSEEVIRNKQRFDKQYKIVRQTDQEERWVQGLGQLEFDEEGKVVRMVGTIQDITEHKNMEAEITKAQKLESVGILAGGIAHDFNNLLQAIMGNIALAKLLTNPEDKIFPLLVESEEASEQAKELSYRLLTFSKGGGPARHIISIGSLLREAVSLSLSGSNVACHLSLPEDLDAVEADEGQMKQVFNNLLINAKEAMPEGGTVQVSAANVRITGSDNLPLKEGNHVKISLADRGTGIPEKHLPRIFDPYFSTKDRGSQKGMGLGLAICHSIITKHEGHIAVESTVGVGTAFHIYLPASPESFLEEKTGKEVDLFAGRGRVLFMDDEERVRRITGAMLEQLGYDVEFAVNGEEAVEAYRKAREAGQTFDTVILDLTVQGGIGGENTLRKLREIDSSVKAVISSGYADDPIMKDFRAYGFGGALAKPYNIEELTELLAKL